MFREDNWFKAGWLYFLAMFPLEAVLPAWTGVENGIIENLQMLWLASGIYRCWKLCSVRLIDWGGRQKSLWQAGVIYFFLLFMREISWGRTFIIMPDGDMIQYSQMGLYGKLVHPLVGFLIIALLVLLYQAKVWRMLLLAGVPIKSFTLLLLFIFMSWVGERTNFTGFHGEVAEELAEFGAYMMMYYLLQDTVKSLQKSDEVEV